MGQLPLWFAVCVALLAPGNYLLIDEQGLNSALRKAEKYSWARQALDDLLRNAERSLRELPPIPARGGQWPHWYSCSRDGATLVTVSPTEHRCPVCGATYRGDPYDAVVIYRVHNRLSRAARDLALAFRFTGREEFASRAKEILAGYADRYRSYARHNINGEDRVGGGRATAQTLDESVWLIPLTWAYALVRDTLDPEARAHIEGDLLLPAAEVIREHKMGIHNIQCWKNTAVGLVGLVTGQRKLVEEAIEDPERGFRAQIARGVTDDGLWWEGSLGYHQYTMQALWPLAEAARLADIDLYSDRYRSLYMAPLLLALPDGSSPGFNDSAGGNLKSAGPLYELAYARWREPAFGRLLSQASRASLEALLWGVEEVPRGPMIPTESVLLRSAGYAVLRSPAMTVAVRFGMHGGGHGHPDKLNIVTYGGGRLFGLDPGSINYGVPLHREWYRSTIAHNTVSVDERLQANVDGTLERWERTAEGAILVAGAGAAYPGVRLIRALELRGAELADRFECTSEAEHTYDWAFHAAGRLAVSLKLMPREGALGQGNGYQHIREVSSGTTGQQWWARWENGGVEWIVRFRGEPGTEVITGYGPGRNPAEKIPVVIVRRRAKSTIFDAIHQVREAAR